MAVRGPVVAHIHRFCHAALAAGYGGQRGPFGLRRWLRDHALLRQRPDALPAAGDAQALFVTRDNHNHQSDIEHHYLQAVRSATRRVVIANAYFFPGYRFIRELRRAARRGVDVCLILQGEPDMPIVKTAASLLYHHLTKAGVRIYEYCERPLHGKVAVVDDDWSTVGSSNLDPLSLTLNLEANLVIRDAAFAQGLAVRLQDLIDHHCKSIAPEPPAPAWAFWRPLSSFLLFHLLSGYSRWANWLPYHAPIMQTMGSQGPGAASPSPGARDGAT